MNNTTDNLMKDRLEKNAMKKQLLKFADDLEKEQLYEASRRVDYVVSQLEADNFKKASLDDMFKLIKRLFRKRRVPNKVIKPKKLEKTIGDIVKEQWNLDLNQPAVRGRDMTGELSDS